MAGKGPAAFIKEKNTFSAQRERRMLNSNFCLPHAAAECSIQRLAVPPGGRATNSVYLSFWSRWRSPAVAEKQAVHHVCRLLNVWGGVGRESLQECERMTERATGRRTHIDPVIMLSVHFLSMSTHVCSVCGLNGGRVLFFQGLTLPLWPFRFKAASRLISR